MLLALAASSVRAEELSLEQVIELSFEEWLVSHESAPNNAGEKLSAEERRQRIERDQERLQALYAQFGTDAKTFARHVARLSKEDSARVREQVLLLEREVLEREAALAAPEEDGPPIQYGFSDEAPVVLEHLPHSEEGHEDPPPKNPVDRASESDAP